MSTSAFGTVATGRLRPNLSDQLGLFWEAWGLVESSYLGELPNSTELTYGAIRGALALLNDPYTIFIEPVAREQERVTLRGTFGGIGATLTRPDEDERYCPRSYSR
jgi:carboxyl-terminal processing protease